MYLVFSYLYLIACAICLRRFSVSCCVSASCPASIVMPDLIGHPDPIPSCPAPTGHHSFFNASAGLVRAALRVCQRTARMAITKDMAIADAYIQNVLPTFTTEFDAS